MLKLQHVGSVLGYMWTLLNPILYIATYWVVFTLFVKMGMERYPLFLIPGFLAWNFTLSSIINSSDSIIQGTYLITKISFPNEILPIASVGISLFDYVVSLILYFIALIVIPGVFTFSYSIILLPVVLFIQILITVGIALIVACISVYFRDVPKLVQVGGTVMFFLTPIFYPVTTIPEKFQAIIMINPMAQIITYYHDILYYDKMPNMIYLSGTFIFSLIIFFIGLAIFNKFKASFAELS